MGQPRWVKPVPESRIEEILDEQMAKSGILSGMYWCQWQEGRYRLDFAFPPIKLNVETDGRRYHSKTRDDMRDLYLRGRGWIVMRLPGSRLVTNPVGCLKEVERTFQEVFQLRLLGDTLPDTPV